MDDTHKFDLKQLRRHTLRFSEGVAKAFEKRLERSCRAIEDSFKIEAEALPRQMHAAAGFHGRIQGEFLISMAEETAVTLAGVKNAPAAEDPDAPAKAFEALTGDLLKPLAETVVKRVEEQLGRLIVTPARMIVGAIHYPNFPIACVRVDAEGALIECRIVLYLERLEIVQRSEPAPNVAASEPRIDRQKNKNLEQIMKMLPELNKMVEELFCIQNVVHHSGIQSADNQGVQHHYYTQLSNLTHKIRRLFSQMWSVSLQKTFEKVGFYIQKFSESYHKEIQINIENEGVEIDRQTEEILSHILETILHNAVEFGIESPETRLALNKTAYGNLFLKGYTENGAIIIEAGDDGQGMNQQRLMELAEYSGILQKEPNISLHQLSQLIFWKSPDGKKIGSHYDARKLLKKVGGRIMVQTEPQKGSRFYIQLPMTLSSTEGIVTAVGGQHYIIPITYIQETIQPRKSDCFTVKQKGEVVRMRNRLFSLIRLERLWGTQKSDTRPWDALGVIVESGELSGCILVDEVIGKQNVVIQNLGESQWLNSESIVGGSIMPDGRVGLVLDVRKVLSLSAGNLSG